MYFYEQLIARKPKSIRVGQISGSANCPGRPSVRVYQLYGIPFLETVLTSLSDSTMTWIGGKRNETGWTWTDGKPFSYTNWAKGQPSSGNCTSIDPSQSNWYSSNCQSLMPYICEIPAEADSCPVQTTVVSTIKPHCRQEYQYFDKWNSCYKYVTAQQAYNLAEQNCINEGGNLVSIHSPEENEFVDSRF